MILNLITSAKGLFPVRSHSQVLGIKTWIYVLGRPHSTLCIHTGTEQSTEALVSVSVCFPAFQQHCQIELSVTIEMFYICAIQQGSHMELLNT